MSFSKVVAKQFEWVDAHSPSAKEVAEIAREANLLQSDAEFLVEDLARPEIAIREDYTFILIRVPVFDKKVRVTSGAPIAFIATAEKLYTIHMQPIVTLEQIRQNIDEHPQEHEPHIGGSVISLALYIIDKLNDSSFRKLARLSKHIDIAEDAVFFGNERKMVEEVAILGRDVLDFRRIIRPHISLFTHVPESLDINTASQWRRVGSQKEQMWEILESLHSSAKELRETNDSLLQHKENELLRLLSLYSIITIPILVLSNPFSGVGEEYALIFWGSLAVLILFLGLVFIRAKVRRVI